jgi:RecB family endonuclease NucS
MPNKKSVATVESLQLQGDEEGMGIIEECLLVYNGWHSLKMLNLSRLLPVKPDDYPTWHTMWMHNPT